MHKNQSQNTKELSEASAIKVHRKQRWLNLYSCRKQQFARLSFLFWRCWKFSSFLSHQETYSSTLKNYQNALQIQAQRVLSDADCNTYWPTRNWSKAQRRKDTEVMQKQDDIKSQTSGSFALTLPGIKGYGQLNQQQCWTARLTAKHSSVLKKQIWLACHYTCSNPMQVMLWLEKILHTL